MSAPAYPTAFFRWWRESSDAHLRNCLVIKSIANAHQLYNVAPLFRKPPAAFLLRRAGNPRRIQWTSVSVSSSRLLYYCTRSRGFSFSDFIASAHLQRSRHSSNGSKGAFSFFLSVIRHSVLYCGKCFAAFSTYLYFF
jgi:hypothetical protein